MQALFVSGELSILTRGGGGTPAARDRDEGGGSPCWATGTPAPATMKAAHVEMLNEPEASPPVPTTSIASSGAATVSILARMAVTAPVISSTVSPPTRRPIRHAPISSGATQPGIMLLNAP